MAAITLKVIKGTARDFYGTVSRKLSKLPERCQWDNWPEFSRKSVFTDPDSTDNKIIINTKKNQWDAVYLVCFVPLSACQSFCLFTADSPYMESLNLRMW